MGRHRMTDATAFLSALLTGPLLRGDAIVVLAGEDGQARADLALGLFKQRAAERIVLSGGRHEPPAILGAAHLAEELIAKGVSPERISVESVSRHTREQAERVIAAAGAGGWQRLLLVASAYHLPRAFLTFVGALAGRLPYGPAPEFAGTPATAPALHVLPVPSYGAWWQAPPGMDRTRMELWPVEQCKITEYQALGHCASYAEGLEYLKSWEGR